MSVFFTRRGRAWTSAQEITFTVRAGIVNENYNATNGMTWADFVESEYNTNSTMYLAGSGASSPIMYGSGSVLALQDGTVVLASELIIADYVYGLAS